MTWQPGTGRDPWSDPSTPTEPGAPYAGPPPTGPPGAVPHGSGVVPPGYGWPPAFPGAVGPGHGWAGHPVPWPVGPQRPRRPGQVVASAVLAFVQAGLVLLASLYVWFFASIIAVATAGAPATLDTRRLEIEGTVLAAVQLVSAILLVAAGVLALGRRRRGSWLLLIAAHAVQVVLGGYWLVRLLALVDLLPGAGSDAPLLGVCLFFVAGPLVGLGLLAPGVVRRWFAPEDSPG